MMTKVCQVYDEPDDQASLGTALLVCQSRAHNAKLVIYGVQPCGKRINKQRTLIVRKNRTGAHCPGHTVIHFQIFRWRVATAARRTPQRR
jgi:hypothetical protein